MDPFQYTQAKFKVDVLILVRVQESKTISKIFLYFPDKPEMRSSYRCYRQNAPPLKNTTAYKFFVNQNPTKIFKDTEYY